MKVKTGQKRLIIMSVLILFVQACNIPSGQTSAQPTAQVPLSATKTKPSPTKAVISPKTPTPTLPGMKSGGNSGGGKTSTPTSSPSPTPTMPDFDSVINFGGGGGGGIAAGLSYCGIYEQSHTVVAPAIYGTAMTIMNKASERTGIICLRGVRPDAPFTIRIVSPDGNIKLNGQFTITGEKNFKIIWGNGSSYEITFWGSREKDGQFYGELYIWWPVGLPSGQWNIYAEGNGLQASGTFDNMMKVIEYVDRTREIGIVEPGAQSNIIPIYNDGLHRVKANPNGGLDVNGAGFTPNELTYILLYKMKGQSGSGYDIQWDLAYSTGAKADSNGRLSINLPGPFATGQEYIVISTTDINRLIDDNGKFNYTDNSIGHDIFDIQSSSGVNDSVTSDIDAKYIALGGEKSFLGQPTEAERIAPDGVGHYRHFEGGSIYWTPNTGAFEVHGPIRDKWAQLGWEKSILGYPTGDEATTPDGIGRYHSFQDGSIYWSPNTGAFEVHGPIRDKWGQLGWEKSILGYPTGDEATTPDGIGRYHSFQGGSIYWTPDTGAFEIHGSIRDKWGQLGWENSCLGYPISDEEPSSDGWDRQSRFQHGIIKWSPSNGAIHTCY